MPSIPQFHLDSPLAERAPIISPLASPAAASPSKDHVEPKSINLTNHQASTKLIYGKAILNKSILINYLLDGGADVSVMSWQTYKKLAKTDPLVLLEPYHGPQISQCHEQIPIAGIVKVAQCQFGTNKEALLYDVQFYVAYWSNALECIVGMDIIERLHLVADDLKAIRKKIELEAIELQNTFLALTPSNAPNDQPMRPSEPPFNPIGVHNMSSALLGVNQVPDSDESDRACAEAILKKEFEKCSVQQLTQLKPHLNDKFAFKIELIDPNCPPINCRIRPIPQHLKDRVKDKLNELEKAHIIAKRKTSWTAPMRVVYYPETDEIRITIDYTALNLVIKSDNYPLPLIRSLYDAAGKCDIFSKIDLKSAYHQLPVHADSIEYTGFACEFGQYV